jgi:hypothetical protein
MPLINIPKTLSGMKVGLSGAMPDPEELAARRWSDFDIRTAVSFFVEAVLRRGGQIVHGTHPTYLPLIEAVVRSLAEGNLVPDGKRPVKMYVVGPYVTELEAKALRMAHEAYADIEVVGPFATASLTPEKSNEQKASALKTMREKMAEHIDALVCIGGRGVRPDVPRPGVLEEIAAAAKAGKPYYLAAALGGFAQVVHKEKLAEKLSIRPNGLEQVQNNQLAEIGDPSTVTELVVKGLQRVWMPRPKSDRMVGPCVFFSYATEDRSLVDRYADAFRSDQIEVLIDHLQIGHGDSIVGALNEALERCRHAVVFFSESYARNQWTNEEQRALLYEFVESSQDAEQSRSIFVVKLDETPLPPLLRHRVWRSAGDPKALAQSIALRLGQAPTGEADRRTRELTGIPMELDGVALEQLGVQLVAALREARPSTSPVRISVILKGHGNVFLDCLPRPASDLVIEDIKASLHVCTSHRRHIAAYQKKLSDGGLSIFDEAFRIALDQQIEYLDRARFGAAREPALREYLDSLILSARAQ